MRTRITELIGIEHPIIQGAMSWVSFPPLVAAVSNAGGLGILGAAFMSPEVLQTNIREIKKETDKPFGVNFMPGHPELENLLDVIVGEKVAVASYGKGDPSHIIERTKPAGIINLPTMGSVKHAKRAEENGAEAVIVQGTEAGGHTGYISTMVLTPRVTNSVKIPVVAAGGIGNAQGLLAALALGAEGVSMGSRFIITKEAPVPDPVKEHILNRTEDETIVTDNFTGVRCRVIRNEFSDSLVEMSSNGTDPWEIMTAGVGKIRQAYVEGDYKGGSLTFGQICGMIDDIPTCQELIDSITSEAEAILLSMQAKVLPLAN